MERLLGAQIANEDDGDVCTWIQSTGTLANFGSVARFRWVENS